MKRFFLLLTTVLMFATTALKAQDSANVYKFNFKKLKPIIQIFGTLLTLIFVPMYAYIFDNKEVVLVKKANELQYMIFKA